MKQEGVAGLFKGVVPVMIRAFPANAVSEELWVLISFVVGGQGHIMLYSCTRHLSLTLPLSTQVGYRRMQCLGVTLRWVSIPRGEWISCSNIGQLAQQRLYRTHITFLCTFM